MRTVGLALIAVSAACGPADVVPDDRIVRRDSAGIAIVESTAPRWARSGPWRVDSVPSLDLTHAGSGPEHEFDQVVGALRLSDGSVVVADGGSRQVRRFTRDGALQWVVGGDGEGPGEFRRIASLALYRGDSIVAFDSRLGRATIVSAAGEVGRTFYVDDGGSRPDRLLGVGDSSFVAQVSHYGQMGGQAGLVRIPLSIVAVSDGGAAGDTLTTIPGIETVVLARGDMRPLFPRLGHVATFGDRVYVGSAERMEFAEYSAAGALERVVRVPGYELRLTSEEVRRERDALADASQHPMVRGMIADLPSPTTRPAYAQIVVDATGAVWTAPYRGRADTTGATPWQVFSTDGEWLGAIELPRRLQVFEIGRDYVLGAYADSLDVQHVQLLRLTREAR